MRFMMGKRALAKARVLLAFSLLCVGLVGSRFALGGGDAGSSADAGTPAAADIELPFSGEDRLERFRQKLTDVDSVRVIPIEGTIELGLASFIQRSLADLNANTAVLLSVKTFGGRVDAATRIRDAVLETGVPTIAYVDRRAISAGALIALAADVIVMSPGASIGAATPVQQGGGGEMQPTSEKVVSYMRAEMRSTAEANDRPGQLAEAMVDADVEIEGVSKKGKLLTLTGKRAVELGVADASYGSRQQAIQGLGLEEATLRRFEINWAERLSRFFTDPIVSSLLMSLGFIGLLMELYSPGFGVGGIIGVTCLGLFFGGHYLAALAGWEELLLLFIGLGLLALEVFVVPGFGVVGIAGLVVVVVSLVMAMVRIDLPWEVAKDLGYLQAALSRAVIQLAVVFVAVGAAAVIFAKKLPQSRVANWLVFRAESPAASSASGVGAEVHGGSLPTRTDLLGQHGTTRTVLRPTGVAEFGDERVHVVTEGEFIDPDTSVEVVTVEGHRVVVRKT